MSHDVSTTAGSGLALAPAFGPPGAVPGTLWDRRWLLVVAATLGMAMGFGMIASASVFMGALEGEFGWARGDISFAYTLTTAGIALGGLVWGSLVDRIGARPVVLLGAVVMSGGVASLSGLASLPMLFAVSLVLGAAGFACLYTPLLTTTALWFDGRRGLAVGIVTAGGALGQGLVPLVARLLVDAQGWRSAYLVLGLGYAVLLVPLMALVTEPPVRRGGAARSSAMVPVPGALAWISSAAFLCCVCMAVPMMHLVPLATDLGHSPSVAAALLMVLMIAGTVGRVAFGFLADRVGALRSYVVASVMQTASVYWFAEVETVAALGMVAAVFGFGFAGNMTGFLLCIRESVPARRLGLSTATGACFAWLGMGVGGFLGGWLHDATHAHAAGFAAAACAGAANLLVLAAFARKRARAKAAG